MHRSQFLRDAAIAGAALALTGPASLAMAATPVPGKPSARAQLVLRRATIYDGSGSAPFVGDVAVTGGRIVEVGARLTTRGDEELDLRDLALAPGFIDTHSHTGEAVLRDASATNKVRQGITTEVAGQDGSSILRDAAAVVGTGASDVTSFLRAVDEQGAIVNMASMVGAGTLRAHIVGLSDRRATPAEAARMTAMVQSSVEGGACGVSSGLEYTPGGYADAAELQALVAPLRGTGLAFASHMRNEDDRLLGAVEEVIGIGQRAGVAVHISHLKAQGERNWWKMQNAMQLIDAARASGVDATFDIYPYVAYSTGITNLFPLWAREGGTDAFIARLADTTESGRIEQAVRDKIAMLGSWDAVQFTTAGADTYGWIVGKKLGALSRERSTEPYALLLDILRGTRGRPGMVGFGMSEENVAAGIAHPASMICSDAGAVAFGAGAPHPRAYGTYPRVLAHFVRDLRALNLETAIRKMTALPAARMRFGDRGRIATGMAADLVAFDPATVADRATFEESHQYPTGIPHVIVNGVFVIRDGALTDARPGRAVRPART